MAGRPVKYKTPEEVQAIIDKYFETDAYIQTGETRLYAPTVSGLALALDLSRQGLIEYQGKPEFSDTIKRAKQKVEVALEQRLHGQAVTGAIFNLKNNFGWKDKTEQNVNNTSSDGSMSPISAESLVDAIKQVVDSDDV